MNNKKDIIDRLDELEKQLSSVDYVIEDLDLKIKASTSKDEKQELELELEKNENLQTEIRSDLANVKA